MLWVGYAHEVSKFWLNASIENISIFVFVGDFVGLQVIELVYELIL